MSDCCSEKSTKSVVGLISGIGTLLVFGALAWYLVRTEKIDPLAAQRAEYRLKTWTELKQSNAETLNNYGVIKAENGVYRLPVAKAVEVMAAEWKDGNVAGRAKLLERLEKSTKTPTYE
jgi:hypothetical protein